MSTDKLQLFSLAPHATKLDNGKPIYLRRITGAERLAIFQKSDDRPKDENILALVLDEQAFVLCLTLCDEHGERYFQDGQEADVKRVLEAQMLDRLFNEAMELNGLTKTGEDAAKKKPETTSTTTDSSAT